MSKSGLHAGTTQRLLAQFMGAVDKIIDCTVSGTYSHTWALRRVEMQVYLQPDFKLLPKWARSAIANYFAGKVDMINRHLTFTGCTVGSTVYAAPGATLGLAYPSWTRLRLNPNPIKVPDETDLFGQYWPSGAPFSVQQPKGSTLHVVDEKVTA